MMIALFFVGAAVLLVAVAFHLVARRPAPAHPVARPDGLGDDLRLGVGLNLYA